MLVLAWNTNNGIDHTYLIKLMIEMQTHFTTDSILSTSNRIPTMGQ